jgi:1-deoxy-D-xylulose-5-phosphate reductoisomerase
VDGSVIAQLGNPDMRTPIAHAMAFPERVDAGVKPLDLFAVGQLNFERPDLERFPWPCPGLPGAGRGGRGAGGAERRQRSGGGCFLDGALGFDRIPR